MTKTYQSDGQRAIKEAEKVLQRPAFSSMSDRITGGTLHRLLVELNTPMYYVELDGDEISGPWLSFRAAEDYIDTHICERGVCDDAYDRVMQDYAITNADGEELTA